MKKQKIIDNLVYIQILIYLFGGIVASYTGLKSIIFRIQDIINVIIIGFCIREYIKIRPNFVTDLKKVMCSQEKYLFAIGGLFLAFSFISFIWSNHSFSGFISRYKQFVAAVVMFACSSKILTDQSIAKIIKTFVFAHYINFVFVLQQTFFTTLSVDFRNGIFGTYDYFNAAEGIFCLIICILALTNMLDKKWSYKKSIILMVMSCIICALAEIKIFFVLFFIVALLTILSKIAKGVNLRKMLPILFGLVGLMIFSFILLKIFFPHNLKSFFSIANYIEYEMYSSNNVAGRLNTIPFVIKNEFDYNPFLCLFGKGIGSCHTSYAYELGKTFSELGFIGVALLFCFFFNILKLSNIFKQYSSEKHVVFMFVIVVLISIIVWNSTFSRSLYLVFFVLGLYNKKIRCEV